MQHNINSLPVETLANLFGWLDLSDIENVMIVSKLYHNICIAVTLPNLLRNLEDYDLIKLPYTENNVFKRCVIAVAVLDCNIKYSALVHPDYACIQALHKNKLDVYEKYCKTMSKVGYVNCLKLIIKKQLYNLAKPIVLRYPKIFYLCYDQVIDSSNEREFIEFIDSLPKLKTKRDSISFTSEKLYKNIAAYGTDFFSDRIISIATEAQHRPHTFQSEDNYIRTVTWEKYTENIIKDYSKKGNRFLSFAQLIEIWSLNRWDLWRATIVVLTKVTGLESKQINFMKHCNTDADSYDLPSNAISILSLRTDMNKIFEKQYRNRYEIKGNSILAYLEYCNKKNILPDTSNITNQAELDVLFKNVPFTEHLKQTNVATTRVPSYSLKGQIQRLKSRPLILPSILYFDEDIVKKAYQAVDQYLNFTKYYNQDSSILPIEQCNEDANPVQLYLSLSNLDNKTRQRVAKAMAEKHQVTWLLNHITRADDFFRPKPLGQAEFDNMLIFLAELKYREWWNHLTDHQLSVLIPVALALNLGLESKNLLEFCDYIRHRQPNLHISYEYYYKYYQAIAPVTLPFFKQIYRSEHLDKFYRYIKTSDLPEHTKSIII